MKRLLSYLLFIGVICLSILGCKEAPKKVEKIIAPPSLKSTFQDNFLIGTALSRQHINQAIPEAIPVIQNEFNSITPENIMKWVNIHPTVDSFNFDIADTFIELGKKQDMFTVGHTLVWHSQIAPYMEEEMDKATMETLLKNHIDAVAGRYKGKIDAWDVINEALNEDGTLRESMFLKVMGEEYLQKSFEWAAAADPHAELYYNDYNIEQREKRKGCIKMLKELQAKGVKIDGVGIQGHWSLNGPPIEEIEESIIEYANLGLKVMFTELDITVLPNPWELEGAEISQNFEGSPFMDPYPTGMPDSVSVQLAQRYADIFGLFLKHQDKISRVTFWGVNDEHSWLNNWPIKDRTNYPLLFDRDFKPKKAYEHVLTLK